MSRFTCESTMVGGKAVFKINWECAPIDARAYGKIARWVRRGKDYSMFDRRKILAMRQFMDDVNNMYLDDADVSSTYNPATLDQAISLRNIVLKDKIITNYARMNHQITQILRLYESGVGILKLSLDYDFPPFNLLRGVFLQKGYNSSEVYDAFANKSDPKKLLNGRDLSQYKIAIANDAESYINQRKIADIAANNEIIFVNFFRKLGIDLKTQDELSAEQVKEHGRAVITPDILFVDTVYINGQLIKWIDFKDYLGTDVKFLYKSNSNQAARYVEKWGPGALCYSHAFVEGMVIPSTMLLDARALPIKLKSSY